MMAITKKKEELREYEVELIYTGKEFIVRNFYGSTLLHPYHRHYRNKVCYTVNIGKTAGVNGYCKDLIREIIVAYDLLDKERKKTTN